MKLKFAAPFIIACSTAKQTSSGQAEQPSIDSFDISSWQIEINSAYYTYSFNTILTDYCKIDWGDGTTQLLSTLNEKIEVSHAYINIGTYIIKLSQYHGYLNFSGDTNIRKMLYISPNIETYQGMFAGSSIQEVADTAIIQSMPKWQLNNYGGIKDNGWILNGLFNIFYKFSFMFQECTSLSAIYGNYSIEFNHMHNPVNGDGDASRYGRMFYNCTNLTIIQPYLDFSGCVYLTWMFKYCSLLANLNINTLPDTVTDAADMFYNCNMLSLDISQLFNSNGIGNHDTGSTGIHLENMFYNCTNMYGDAPANILWESGKPIISENMFTGCTNLSNYSNIPYTYGGIAPVLNTTNYTLDYSINTSFVLDISYDTSNCSISYNIQSDPMTLEPSPFSIDQAGNITMNSPADGEYSVNITISTTNTNTWNSGILSTSINISVINASSSSGGAADGTVNESIITQYQIIPSGTDSGNAGYYQVYINATEPNTAISIDWGDGNTETFISDEWNSQLYASHQYSDSYMPYVITIKGDHSYVDIYDSMYSQFVTRVDYHIYNTETGESSGSGENSGSGSSDSSVNESIITQYQIIPSGTDSGNAGYYQVNITPSSSNIGISIDWGDGNIETFISDQWNSPIYASHQYPDSYMAYLITIKGEHSYVDMEDGMYSQYITRVEYKRYNMETGESGWTI